MTRCRISMCQGLGPTKHDEISEIDRTEYRIAWCHGILHQRCMESTLRYAMRCDPHHCPSWDIWYRSRYAISRQMSWHGESQNALPVLHDTGASESSRDASWASTRGSLRQRGALQGGRSAGRLVTWRASRVANPSRSTVVRCGAVLPLRDATRHDTAEVQQTIVHCGVTQCRVTQSLGTRPTSPLSARQ